MTVFKPIPWVGAILLLAACNTTNSLGVSNITQTSQMTKAENVSGPPNAKAGACYGRDVTPAVIETVTEQIILQPAELDSDGKITSPAIYREETREAIVQERQELWFEVPCEMSNNPEFIASLQRALSARGLFSGSVTGQYDRRTQRAVRAFQRPKGLDSSVLSLAAARLLGLAAVPREDS